jgi:hypothetical protein
MKLYCFAAILLLSISACHNGHQHGKDDVHTHDGETHDHHTDISDSAQQEFIIEQDSALINIPNPQ